MHTISFSIPAFSSFGGWRHRRASLAAAGSRFQRWIAHARIAAMTAALCDLRINPFLFQIESGR